MNITTGALLDNRTEEEKGKDFLHEELASGFEPYVWQERMYKPSYFYPHNQFTSLSCVAGGCAIILEHYDGKVVSRHDIYQRRFNYPQGGMAMPDAFSIMRMGSALESTIASQGLGENAMNERYVVTPQIITERDANKTGVYVSIQGFRNIDTIASVVKHTPVMMYWFFDESGQEWWREYPTVKFNIANEFSTVVVRHQVCIVDAVLIGGKKYLVGQDTAGVGSGLGEHNNLRLISEDVLQKRSYAGGYCLDNDDEILKPVIIPVQPVFALTATLKVGDVGPNVRKLQEVLMYEGLLKIKAPTGTYGGLTRQAVIKLQEKYRSEILTPVGLKNGTGICGPRTLAFLRKKYA